MAALADVAEEPTELHFFRTHSQAEVDFVLSRPGQLVGIEVKHGATVRPRDASGLASLAADFPEEFHLGIVLYSGDAVFPVSSRSIAVPLRAFFGSCQ